MFSQWTQRGDGSYQPVGSTCEKLPPGYYRIIHTEQGFCFLPQGARIDGLLRLPHTCHETILAEIERFWTLRERFRDFGISYRRGIFLYGPPGNGKTSLIRLLCADVMARGGVMIEFTESWLFTPAMTRFREIQPETPVVVTLEDLDAIMERPNESEVLNILDGVASLDNAVFLATSNYPERLGERVWNRPSRFDRRFYIPDPPPESRRVFLEFLAKGKPVDMDIAQWVEDTNGFSLAHLQELFTGTQVLSNSYDEVLAALKSMQKAPEGDTGKAKTGFQYATNGSMLTKEATHV